MSYFGSKGYRSDPRTARTRRYLMCRPTYFDVVYSINPWMEPGKPVDQSLALLQWEQLRETFVELGHTVDLIDPLPGLPDMVFAANGATVVDGRVLSARFRHAERAAEGPVYTEWFRRRNYQTYETRHINEGEGDYLVTGDRILAGTGFRTDPGAHSEAAAFFDPSETLAQRLALLRRYSVRWVLYDRGGAPSTVAFDASISQWGTPYATSPDGAFVLIKVGR